MRTNEPRAPGVADEGLEQGAAEVDVELQPEPGQLDRDVGVEPVGVDRGEHVGIGLGDRTRLLLVVHLLAEHVDGGALAGGVQAHDRAAGVVERRAGDVRGRDPLHERSRDGGQHGGNGTVEEGHGDATVARSSSVVWENAAIANETR